MLPHELNLDLETQPDALKHDKLRRRQSKKGAHLRLNLGHLRCDLGHHRGCSGHHLRGDALNRLHGWHDRCRHCGDWSDRCHSCGLDWGQGNLGQHRRACHHCRSGSYNANRRCCCCTHIGSYRCGWCCRGCCDWCCCGCCDGCCSKGHCSNTCTLCGS